MLRQSRARTVSSLIHPLVHLCRPCLMLAAVVLLMLGLVVAAPTESRGAGLQSDTAADALIGDPGQRSSQKQSQDAGTQADIAVTGLLHRAAAIGGETTGWAVRMQQPLTLSAGRQVSDIELEADRDLLMPLQGRQVEVHGRIAWKFGIERGRYPFIMVKSVKAVQ